MLHVHPYFGVHAMGQDELLDQLENISIRPAIVFCF